MSTGMVQSAARSKLEEQVRNIVREALTTRWAELEPSIRDMVLETVGGYQPWHMNDTVNRAIEKVLPQVIEEHLRDTFAPALNEIAYMKARAKVAKQLKALGLSDDWLNKREGGQDEGK